MTVRFFKTIPVKSPDDLRNKIVASISNPFPDIDTMILDTTWWVCGNSQSDELPVVFDTYLQNNNYRQLLEKKTQKRILTNTEFEEILDSIVRVKFNNTHPFGLWDSCLVGKVSAQIIAEKLSPRHVQLQESYNDGYTEKYIEKDFTFNGDKWTFAVADSVTRLIAEKKVKDVSPQKEELQKLGL